MAALKKRFTGGLSGRRQRSERRLTDDPYSTPSRSMGSIQRLLIGIPSLASTELLSSSDPALTMFILSERYLKTTTVLQGFMYSLAVRSLLNTCPSTVGDLLERLSPMKMPPKSHERKT